MESKQTVRRYGVLVKLNEAERNGLAFLRDKESLAGAQVLRRLLIREVLASHQTGRNSDGEIKNGRLWVLCGTTRNGQRERHGGDEL